MTIEDAKKYVDDNFSIMSPQDCKDFIQSLPDEPWLNEFFDYTMQGRKIAQYSAYADNK